MTRDLFQIQLNFSEVFVTLEWKPKIWMNEKIFVNREKQSKDAHK